MLSGLRKGVRMRTKFSVVGGAVLAASLGGCGGGWSMAVPHDVTSVSDELPITERSAWSGALADESFNMGSYRVKDVDRKWNSTNRTSAFGFDASRTQGGYGYKFKSQGAELTAGCATEQREKSANLGGGLEFSKLVAKLGCFCADDRSEASLSLDASTTAQFAGMVKGADYSYRITAITERENGRMQSHDPLGYRVDGEGPLAAVGVVKPGRVWLSKALPERTRDELACLFAGLMLYEPPKDR